MQFRKIEEYPAEPPELSPSRVKLAALIEQRDTITAAAKVELERSIKLQTVRDDVAPARAALDAFDRQTAVAMSNWAAGNVTGKPKGDAARRAQLAAELADAELSSAAAKAAQDEAQREAERIARSLTPIAVEIGKLARIVAIEEAAGLLPKIAAAIAAAESLRSQLEAAREEAGSNIPFGARDFGDVHRAIEHFDTARRAAEARQFEPPVNPHADRWRKFTAALTQDAAIDFETAQTMNVAPTIVHAQTIDPVSAAARAIESFSTNSDGGWAS